MNISNELLSLNQKSEPLPDNVPYLSLEQKDSLVETSQKEIPSFESLLIE